MRKRFKPNDLVLYVESRRAVVAGTPAGRLLRIPLTVEQHQGADNGRVRKVEVEVSFDDGKTWRGVPVVGGAALVRNADRAGYASLRAKGSDSLGNTFEHSVIRAYRLTE